MTLKYPNRFFSCDFCGEQKRIKDIAKWNRSKKHYCSIKCFGFGQKGKVTWMKGKKHSKKSIGKMILKKIGFIPWNKGMVFPEKSGKNCHLWKGGITKLSAQIRVCEEYRIWRRKCLERDNFTCIECGQRGGNKYVDHIKYFAGILKKYKIISLEQARKCKELWDIKNGRTLCLNCHANTDTFPSNLREYIKTGKYNYVGKFIKRNCELCNKEFKTSEYILTIRKGKYCSLPCYWNSRVGKTFVKEK